MEHTRTPWTVGEPHVDTGRILIASPDDYICEITGFPGEALPDANAAFIVRACNAHDDLVEAAEAITKPSVYMGRHNRNGVDRVELSISPADYDRLRSAIEKAKL